MDEKCLRARLARLYTITTALILAAVFITVALLSIRETRQKDKDNFLSLFTAVAEGLQTDSTVSHSTLREYERNNGMYFFVTDAGNKLQYNSDDGMERTELLERVTEIARGEGLDVTLVPLTAARRTSRVLELWYDARLFYGVVSVIPIDSTFRILVAAKAADNPWQDWRLIIFGAGYLLSLLLLRFIGVSFIDRALRPAVEGRARQTEFIAAASHELRSPLSVIRANAATVKELPERASAAAATIDNECDRLSKLISDMLLLASTDAKGWPVTLAPLEPDTLLISVYEAYTPVCRKRGFRLSLSLPQDQLPQIKGDYERLSQVLGILLDNAMNYSETAEDRSIAISAYAQKERLFIEVRDHGAGVSDEQKAHVFDRFYRGDKARSEKQHFGLGLSIAKELITLHNGAIRVKDTPGGGSTFIITI